MKGKYVAYNCIYDEIEEFNTFEEAVKWLEAIDYDEGIPYEVVDGGNFIAKITHRSKYKITDSKDKYCQKVESYNDCVKLVKTIVKLSLGLIAKMLKLSAKLFMRR